MSDLTERLEAWLGHSKSDRYCTDLTECHHVAEARAVAPFIELELLRARLEQAEVLRDAYHGAPIVHRQEFCAKYHPACVCIPELERRIREREGK